MMILIIKNNNDNNKKNNNNNDDDNNIDNINIIDCSQYLCGRSSVHNMRFLLLPNTITRQISLLVHAVYFLVG